MTSTPTIDHAIAAQRVLHLLFTRLAELAGDTAVGTANPAEGAVTQPQTLRADEDESAVDDADAIVRLLAIRAGRGRRRGQAGEPAMQDAVIMLRVAVTAAATGADPYALERATTAVERALAHQLIEDPGFPGTTQPHDLRVSIGDAEITAETEDEELRGRRSALVAFRATLEATVPRQPES